MPACGLQVKLCAARNILLNWLDYGHGQACSRGTGTGSGWACALGRTANCNYNSNNEKQFSVCQGISCCRAVLCRAPLQRQLKCVNMADLGAELTVGQP